MLELIGTILDLSASDSVVVVEADARFEFDQLPQNEEWDVREYMPAVVGVWRS